MSKKVYNVLALIIMAALVLSACATPATQAPVAETQAAPAATEAAPAATQPAAASGDCSSADVFCVGLVTDVGKIDDKSFNQSTWEGVKQAETELGAKVQYIETTDPKDYAKNIAQFADEKYDVIVTVGFALGEATQAAAVKYPDIKFIGVDQFQDPAKPKDWQGDWPIKNLAGLVFAEDQSGFLAGALAAQMTKSGKIGAVLGTDVVPPVWRFGEGYRAGALYINPKIDLSIVYHSDVGMDKTFSDPEWGKTTAISMIDKGVDVIFGAGGKTGNGALLGCAEKNVLAIGVDTDQYLTVPEAQKVLLSSAMKLLSPGTFALVKMAKGGQFPTGNFTGDAGLAPFHDLESKVPAEVKAKMEQIAKGLKDGSIKTNVPPAKPSA